jgi:aconitate hydratase
MTRGTFANVRIKNLMLGGEEGGNTIGPGRREDFHLRRLDGLPEGQGTPLIVIAGQEYGTGSAATGPRKARTCSA